ncbi:hypothetical protein [Bacillus massiliigorillae]|uniref:hypothetical protein n=1 Tax=Bacillus massiliigorillae TaxID=1243664 RepID=UPI0003AA7E70|nr:hypothetical protein [Bacillus massiliigorillae]
MFKIIDYQATEPISMVNNNNPIPIAHSPQHSVLAAISICIPRRNSHHNHVQLIATLGLRGLVETSQILFKIFRDGQEIFRAQQGIESDPTSEVNYIVTFQAIDKNVGRGQHHYQVTAENITPDTEAAVVGPISFSGLAIASDDCDDF